MTFLEEQVPGALLRAIDKASANATASGTQPDGGAVLRDVSSQYPILGLWPIAILLSFAAIAILAVLLKLVWSLARANLCFFRTYTVHYPSRNDTHWQLPFPSLGYDDAYSSSYTGQNASAISSGRTRKLVLPAEGFIHLVAIVLCAAVITRLLTVETRGRLAWLGLVNVLARNVELACAWTAVLYTALASIRAVPLLSCRTSLTACRARKIGYHHAASSVPRRLSKPLLHPLLASSLTIVAPLAMCALPIFAVLASSAKSIWAFESMLGVSAPIPLNSTQGSIAAGLAGLSRRTETAISNGTSVLQDGLEQSVVQSLENAAHSYRLERGVHFILLLDLICIAASIEWAAQNRLSALAVHLEEEENSLADQALDEKAHPSDFSGDLHRAPSFASRASSVPRSLYGHQARRPPSRAFSGHSGSYQATHRYRPPLSSRASSYSHSSSSSRLHVPQLPELDMPIPSPSLMKECGGAIFAHVHSRKSELSPYSPALGVVHDQRCRATDSYYTPDSGCGLGLQRQDSRSSASSLACSHRENGNGYMQSPRRPPLLRTNSGSMKRTSYRSASCTDPGYCDAEHHEPLESPRYRRPASRASSYHSHRSASSSSYSRKSSLSYASRRSFGASLTQMTYTGPSSLHVRALKKARTVDAFMLGVVLFLDALLELLNMTLGKLVLNAKPLFAIASVASALLHVLPVLGGVILCAIRSSSATYGWTSKHLVVESDETAVNQVVGFTVPYSPFEKADLQ